MLRFFYRNRQEQDTPFLKNGITLLNAMALFAWLTTHALLSDYYSLIGKVDYNPRLASRSKSFRLRKRGKQEKLAFRAKAF